MDQWARGWHSRLYFPHFDGGEITQSVTFHLGDSFPTALKERWRDELKFLPQLEAERERRKRIEAYLDLGYGEAILRDERIAALVEAALLFFDNERYHLHAWVIMPNHVHALFTLMPPFPMEKILHSWKSFTFHEANKVLHRKGDLWFHDYFDRYIRDENHFHNVIAYIENNPVKAGLCESPEGWPWSSASWERRHPGSAPIYRGAPRG